MAKLEIPIKVDLDEIDKLIDELRHLQTYKLYEGADQKLVDLDEVVKIFAGHVKAEGEQSTIKPERKKGKWDTFFSDSYKVHEIGVECSCCGYRTQERTTYCPNCGAEMRGEEHDND